MSNRTIDPSDHEEIMAILPWFVNQTLEEQQRKTVSSHIEHCADCRSEIQFLTTLNATVADEAQHLHSTQADVDKSLAGVMDRIESTNQQLKPTDSAISRLQPKLVEMFQSAFSFPQWSAAALAGLLVAVLGFQLYTGQVDNDYSVLSSSGIQNPSMRLSVEMAPTANQERAQAIIQLEIDKLGQAIDLERDTNGSYIVVFNSAIDVSKLSEFVIALENDTQIQRVEILP
ncbi:MAG: hypothetical protein AB8B64_25100 [Granulosicoccus sp.]